VFVGSENTPLRGYSIELWDRIATQLDEDYEFVVFETVAEVLEAIEVGEVDAAIAGITITAEREGQLDFTHYYYESGLRILVLDQPENPLFSALRFIFSRSMLEAVGFLLGVALISAHLLWFFERHQNPEMFPKSYLRGIWEALWWSLVTATTVGYGDKAPKGFVGRLVAIVWMFAGLFVVAYFTAAITTNRLAANIVRLEDLYGKRVGAVAETTAANYMRQQPVKLVEYEVAEQTYQALREGRVRAVVNDAPTLLYRASQEEDLQVVGPLFAQQDYGIVVPQGSEYRDRINRILLQLRETGELDDLQQKWFPRRN
jgi:ABC-type amino acid transport substrate-binding protein